MWVVVLLAENFSCKATTSLLTFVFRHVKIKIKTVKILEVFIMGGLAIIFVLTFGCGVFKFLYECIFKACNEGRTWEEDWEWNEKRRAVKSYYAFREFLYKEGFVEKGSETEETDIYSLFFYLQNLQYEREWEKRQYVKLYGYAGTIKRFCNYTPEKFEEYLVQLDKIEHDYDKEVLRPFHAAFEFAEWNSTYLYERRVNYWKDLKNEFTEEELARK